MSNGEHKIISNLNDNKISEKPEINIDNFCPPPMFFY